MEISAQKVKEFASNKKNQVSTWWNESGKEWFKEGTNMAVATLPLLVVAGLGTVAISFFSSKATTKGLIAGCGDHTETES